MRTRKIGAVLLAAAAVTLVASQPAQAVPAANGYLDSITFVGSDTIQDVDSGLTALFNTEANNTDPDRATNVPAQLTGTVTAPGDRACAPTTYAQTPTGTQTQSPNGSGAGKTALLNSITGGNGCVDVARSSSGRAAADPSTFQYFAFARDAVSWSASAGGNAPANLTIDQLRGVYNCSFTDWSQVGGTAGQIQRYLPQASSGTRTFFINNVLGGADPTTVMSAACPAVKIIEENAANQVAAADVPNAIYPFSAAQFVAQSDKVTLPNGTVVPDRRGDFTVRAIDGKNPVVLNGTDYNPNNTVYNDSTFLGGRNVYHVLDTRSASYSEALRMVGFDSAGPSALCSGAYSSTLAKYGFSPLPRSSAAQGTFCRVL